MPPPESPRLGWIGLGSMGLAMAQNIQKALTEKAMTPLCYTNRTLSRGDALQELGGIPCPSIAELVQRCDIVFISVSDDAVHKAVIRQILASGPITHKTIVDTTTVHPATTSSSSSLIHARGATFIAAPVFGATPLAQTGTLLVATAGPDAALQTISPFLEGVVARKVLHVGPEAAQALLLKTTSNYITAGLMFLMSEAHVLAEKAGLPAGVLEGLVQENFGDMAYSDSRRMTGGEYFPRESERPWSDLELGIKDVGIGIGVARDVGMELEVGELVMRSMREAREYGGQRGRRLDSSSMYGIVRKNAGLEFETEGVRKRDGEGR
ncbi:6-phosphogluconate dehydrogenase-like protein NAD-binding protein [Polyplosphaeria fusca]|uniref:6-phosphogluconate dehydrogenase-like protein NAD-binding protein n=1 Tax=Polyplosphaeria fusca TaxID=682080 RepID=A0A9P4RBC9_9PLEO|nr:6-phosphogluconate dehydrogenase-like protein NAD-binding protein [Polyplosphaeria fusca]